MAAVIIGVDPHKASHTAVAIGPAEEPLGQVRVSAPAAQAGSCWRGLQPGRSGPGRSSPPPGSATCWPSSWSPPASRCWTCPPKLAARVRVLEAGNTTRTTRTTPGRWRSPRCARRRGARSPPRASGGAALVVQTQPRPRQAPHPGRVPAPRGAAELAPGGIAKEINAGQAAGLLARIKPADPGRTDPPRPRRRTPRRSTPHRRPDARHPRRLTAAVTASGTTPDRTSSASARSSPPPHRLHRRRRPLRRPRPVRRLQRHRPGRALLRRAEDAPALAARQPAPQPRHPHAPPSARSATRTLRRPRLLRPQDRRGQDQQGSPPRAQTPGQRRRLRPAPPTPPAMARPPI